MTHTPSESSLKSQPNENKNCTASTSNRKATRRLLKKNFPIFLAEALITFSVSGILLTMVSMSKIIFPNDSFHPFEMAVLISVRMWTVAFAGLLFGFIVDRRSRKPIFIGILVLAGIGRLINGFIPSDNENTMYFLFILCNIIVGFGHGGLQPASISYADDAIEPELRSRFFGLYEIFRQVFQILGMILCAWMFQIGL
ncbi:MAG TPA: MFS transporter, partial [Candidatus Lokiarchaeia archaeon]